MTKSDNELVQEAYEGFGCYLRHQIASNVFLNRHQEGIGIALSAFVRRDDYKLTENIPFHPLTDEERAALGQSKEQE